MKAFLQPVTIPYRSYLITTDKVQLQPEAIHRWLSTESYWAKGIPYEAVQTSFDHSFTIGVLFNGAQIGGARLITDYAVFGYLADVYVETAHRGQGISKEMMRVMMSLDWVKNLRRLMLATSDAHGLYRQCGFEELASPDRIMEILRPNIYAQISS